MGRYNFVSPGAVAGGSVEEVLAKHRAEARQALLDEMTIKNSDSLRTNRDAQLALQTQESLSQNALREQQSKASKVNMEGDLLKQHGLRKGDDPSHLNEEIQKLLLERGFLEDQAPVPSVSTSESGFAIPGVDNAQFAAPDMPTSVPTTMGMIPEAATPGKKVFKGNADEREASDIDMEMIKAMETIKANPDMSDTEKVLLAATAAKGRPYPAGFWNSLETPAPIYSYDNANGQFAPATVGGEAIPPGSKIIERSRPPVGPQPQNPMYLGIDNGQIVWGSEGNAFKRNPDGTQIPFFGTPGAKPTNASTKKEPLLPPAVSEKLGKLRANAMDSPGGLLGIGGRTATPLQKAEYRAEAIAAISMAKSVHPSVNEAVLNVFNGKHPVEGQPFSPTQTAEDIADVLSTQEGVTSDELYDFVKLLRQVRGF